MKKRALCPLSGVHLTIKPEKFGVEIDFLKDIIEKLEKLDV